MKSSRPLGGGYERVMEMLLRAYESQDAVDQEEAVEKLAALVQREPHAWDVLLSLSALPLLVDMMHCSDPGSVLASNGAAAMASLVYIDDEQRRDALVESGSLDVLARMLEGADVSGVPAANAAGALMGVAAGSAMNKGAMVSCGLIPTLIRVVELGIPDSEAVLYAMWALVNIAHDFQRGIQAVLDGAAIRPLLRVIERAPLGSRSSALAARSLLRIARSPHARGSFAKHCAGYDRLWRISGRSTLACLQSFLVAVAFDGVTSTMRDHPECSARIKDVVHEFCRAAAAWEADSGSDDWHAEKLHASDFVHSISMIVADESSRLMVIGDNCATGVRLAGALLSLLERSHPSDQREKTWAVNALGCLTTSTRLCKRLESELHLSERLELAKIYFRDSGHEDLIEGIDGTLLECGRHGNVAAAAPEEKRPRRQASLAETTTSCTTADACDGGPARQDWIMISYNWGHQDVALFLARCLKRRNYRVWVDVENLQGDLAEAMAEAVERAALVVVVVTSAYKKSTNCQSELKYAHKLRKTIVPVLAEPGYEPDGWLGLIVGDKLRYDFRDRVQWPTSFEGLARDIERSHPHQPIHQSGGAAGGGGGGFLQRTLSHSSVPPLPATAVAGPGEDSPSWTPSKSNSQSGSVGECVQCAQPIDLRSGKRFCGRCGTFLVCKGCGSKYTLGHGQQFCEDCGARCSSSTTTSS